MLLAILCTISLTWPAVSAVFINASRIIAIRDQNIEVVLPCNYTLDDWNHLVNIKWRCGDETVLVKDSDGQVRSGRNYRGRADMGMGCSLVLRNPRTSDTNLYTVRVIVPRDKHKEEQQDVFLVVSDTPRIPKTSTRGSVELTTTNDAIIKTDAHVTRRTYSTHDLVFSVCVVIYGPVWLLIYCFSLCKDARSGRISVAVMRLWWKVTLVSTPVLLLVGTIMCVIGLIRRDWTLSLVGVPVTLMGTFVCVLYLTLDARRSGIQATDRHMEWGMKDGSNNNLTNPSDNCCRDTTSAVLLHAAPAITPITA